jgi:1,4-dihydroxy-2-naphthoate octaprenyltransferase
VASKTKTSGNRKNVTASRSDWISGARLRTLPLAIAPVAIGSGAASLIDRFDPVLAILCLVVSLCLQIAVNYANDYSDGIRGTDDFRVGPQRLTGSGKAEPKRVLAVAGAFFILAAIAGAAVILITGFWWLAAIGAAAIVAAWFYTGGKRPYGYSGLGELFVFIFFGLVATVGTTYVQAGLVNVESWFGGVGAGLVACSVLMVNNIRDIATDTKAGKKTLAVRMGRRASVVAFCALLLIPFALAAVLAMLYPLVWLVQFGLLIALPACVIASTAKTPGEYVLSLKLASFVGLVFGAGLTVGFFF